MSFTYNLKNAASGLQQGAKNASISLGQRLLRFVSSLLLGLVLSLIIQEFAQSETLMLIFFTALITMIMYRLLRPLRIIHIVVFDMICILVATLLRMYIIIAP
ncbi:MAG: hypothetical protein AABY53_10360 [Bdellovibrionota bacterium]